MATTALSDGGYLEIWYEAPSDGAGPGMLHVQKHAADGSLVGAEYTHASEASYSLLALSNGGYVVGTAESAPGGVVLRGEVFNASAAHLTEFVAGKDWQMAASPDGGFLVTSTYATNLPDHRDFPPDRIVRVQYVALTYDRAGNLTDKKIYSDYEVPRP